jgi:hypothetical protein
MLSLLVCVVWAFNVTNGNMAPAFRVKKGEEGRMLTWINDGDDNMARPLACQVVAIVRPLLQHAPCF